MARNASQPSAFVRTNGAMLNVRQEPNERAAVVDKLYNGQKVTVAKSNTAPEGWTALSNGYAMTRYLSLEE